jgi:MFS family permease
MLSAKYAAPTCMFSIGIALHAFNTFIASTTMPAAAGELNTAALLSWTTSAYLTASIAGGAAAAVLRVRFGARTVLFLSSIAFMAGTVAFASAAAAPLLICGRALQGVAEGIVVACCYALIPELFPRRLVPQIFALESVVWVLAAFGGPLVAGAIAEAASWRAAVLVNIPASAAFVILVPFCVPAGKAAAKATLTGMPIPQLGLIVLGIFLLSAGGVAGHRLLSVLIMGGAGLVLGLAVLVDSRSATRVFPTNAFRLSDPMGAGLLLVLLLSMTEAPASIYAAFMGQKLWSLNAVEAGTLSATIAISWSLTAIVVAHAPRFTASTYVWPAPLILAAGLAGNVVALGFASLPAAIVGQILIGASFGLSWARLCERVMDAAPVAERDFAASALPTVLSAGLAIGAAFFGALAGWSNLKADDSAAEISAVLIPLFALGAAIAGASTFVALRTTRSAMTQEPAAAP